MDIETRMRICRLLEFAGQDPSYSERVGVSDKSFYREARSRTDEPSDAGEHSHTDRLNGRQKTIPWMLTLQIQK